MYLEKIQLDNLKEEYGPLDFNLFQKELRKCLINFKWICDFYLEANYKYIIGVSLHLQT